ncbi:TPA: FHIPEP family type III secretion protein, partial [Escherichia coli]
NFRLKPSQYAIFINGIKADEADIPADKLMALPSSETYGEIDGVLGNDPAYGMPVTWIQPAQKAKALVDKAQGNPLTQRIRGVRQVISDGNGVLLPEIRIR